MADEPTAIRARRGFGVLGMKSMGNGLILRSGVASAEECPRHALTLLARTAEAAASGRREPFKTSSAFDSTAEHRERLGEEPGWVGGAVET